MTLKNIYSIIFNTFEILKPDIYPASPTSSAMRTAATAARG